MSQIKKKKKIFIYIFFLIIFLSVILLTLGWYDVRKGNSVKVLKVIPIQLIIPEKIRTFLKSTLFYIPNLQNLNDEQTKDLEKFKNLQRHSDELWKIASSKNFEKINSFLAGKKVIKTDKNGSCKGYESYNF